MAKEKTELPKPEKGGTPKKIETENPPGGPQTPGAKRDENTKTFLKFGKS